MSNTIKKQTRKTFHRCTKTDTKFTNIFKDKKQHRLNHGFLKNASESAKIIMVFMYLCKIFQMKLSITYIICVVLHKFRKYKTQILMIRKQQVLILFPFNECSIKYCKGNISCTYLLQKGCSQFFCLHNKVLQ